VLLSTSRALPLRRSSGQWLIALSSALLWSALAAPPATAAVLTPTPNPLPGSTFQGADGNQDNPAAPSTNIDWQAMQAAGRAYHAPDPNAEDSAFTGGSTENEPGQWGLTTESGGVKPDKANILDAWFAADQGGAETFGYGGFARRSEGGTAFLTFELNHDARLWNNGQATIPCRRTDDLLIAFEPQGNDVEVLVRRWVTETADAATGCAKTGHLDGLTGLTPNVDVQGAINAGAIIARLPGFYHGAIPAERFGEAALNLSRFLGEALDNACFSFGSVWMHSRSSPSESANMQDYVAPKALALRSCAASGVKFNDVNGNGRRDAGEPGLQGWVIWADYDDDGVRDPGEPFGITDHEGQYVINDIRPPDGTYMLRETLPTAAARRRAAAAAVRCSYPNANTPGGTGSAPGGMFPCGWGPIATATTSYARGRDFGNFRAARLVVRKELEPSSDPGRFNLLVDGTIVVAGAGDGASRTLAVRPGVHTISERAVAGTNPANYLSSVDCKRGVRRAQRRSGPVYTELTLVGGETAVCTFRNVRRGALAIAIDKTGPASAEAGDTLRYTIYVTNPGDVPFPAASVRVTDPTCDDPPALVSKAGPGGGTDASPGTLDPGDTWTYACSRRTTAGADCQPSTVPNTATVNGTVGGTTVSDQVTIQTQLRCPPPPPQPPPEPPPAPPQPPPLVPPGPKPPNAGDAARASLLLRRAARGCIRTRVPPVNFEGTRIARIQVFVNGQLRRRITVESLQRRLTPRVQLAPGRYRLSVRVTFQRGTGSPPVTLTQVIRICGVSRPPFTG
jgi:uncharacterized repeat protein (TIGR01451 family)